MIHLKFVAIFLGGTIIVELIRSLCGISTASEQIEHLPAQAINAALYMLWGITLYHALRKYLAD